MQPPLQWQPLAVAAPIAATMPLPPTPEPDTARAGTAPRPDEEDLLVALARREGAVLDLRRALSAERSRAATLEAALRSAEAGAAAAQQSLASVSARAAALDAELAGLRAHLAAVEGRRSYRAVDRVTRVVVRIPGVDRLRRRGVRRPAP